MISLTLCSTRLGTGVIDTIVLGASGNLEPLP